MTTDQLELALPREQQRRHARQALGLEEVGSPTTRTSWLRTALALGAVSAWAAAPLALLTLLADQIGVTSGLGGGAIGGGRALLVLATVGSAFGFVALAQRTGRRLDLIRLSAGLTPLAVALAAVAANTSTFLFALLAAGSAAGAASALHLPLVLDVAHVGARGRAVALYLASALTGPVVVALLVSMFGRDGGLSWRAVLLLCAAGGLVSALVLTGLRDPGHSDLGQDASADEEHDGVELGYGESFRRVWLTPMVRTMLLGLAAVGAAGLPVHSVFGFYLQFRWDKELDARGLLFTALFVCAPLGAVAVARRLDRDLRTDPSALLRVAGLCLLASGVLLVCGGFVWWLPVALVLLGLSGGAAVAALPPLLLALLMAMPPRQRPHAAALGGLAFSLGGLAQLFGVGSFRVHYGFAGAMLTLAPLLVGAGMSLRKHSTQLPADLDRLVEEVLDAQEIAAVRRSGTVLPLLACRGVDFSYGQLQVLFDVDLTIREGEMLALLGVNGAGKSTLLKVISGICLPKAGSVRFSGEDITYLDAERRVRMGITQIPGGRAVFGRMTVVENLRSYGYTLPRSRREVDDAVDRSLAAFPRLYERRASLASTLSGGEQQMLAMSKALILRPRLLLIDELSLGLAPVIVGQLLEMVRTINAQGTAIVLVEQSVNIALNLVDHAYFMEKGAMRFDGASKDLLERGDLLRAVFLQGAGAAGVDS